MLKIGENVSANLINNNLKIFNLANNTNKYITSIILPTKAPQCN